MKTSLTASLSLLSVVALLSPAFAGNGDGNNGNGVGNQPVEPLLPTGSLDAFPTLVQTGTHPTLSWEIQYPESILDIIQIDPEDGSIVPLEDLCMEIRVLGASYQVGVDRKGRPVWGYVEAQARIGSSGSFAQFFYDTQDDVKPSYLYGFASVPAMTRIDFRARCFNGGQWLPWRSTESASPNVVALINGDQPPSSVPAFSQGNIEDFLDPYLDEGGKVEIGPKDVIYLIELGQTDTTSSGFDLQDIVLLVSFDYCKNNNGHGNNEDGVDVSNPGQGNGGPNGGDDPSGTVDDEIH
ncbi:hypothetical protein HNR46_003643 [Haloferula luteola]|uniref:DUF4114 domain-containing protein n=1 Tax=Haloferula luteola TaxID=595692 RepID=A0A840V8K6_9BACT|nr:hypothetical protein [Haloferula luteola]MBB5353386.1 hypothetical protein [Haloferula luteola]